MIDGKIPQYLIDEKIPQHLLDEIEERRKNPRRCAICSERKGGTVYFSAENLDWYHCPRCDGHGYRSWHGAFCTNCANRGVR